MKPPQFPVGLSVLSLSFLTFPVSKLQGVGDLDVLLTLEFPDPFDTIIFAHGTTPTDWNKVVTACNGRIRQELSEVGLAEVDKRIFAFRNEHGLIIQRAKHARRP